MREFKYEVGVIDPIFLLNLLIVKMSEKSSTKADFRGKNQKDITVTDVSSVVFNFSILLWLNRKGESIGTKTIKNLYYSGV